MTTVEFKRAITTRIAELKADDSRWFEYECGVITDVMDDDDWETAAKESEYWDYLEEWALEDSERDFQDWCDEDIDQYLMRIVKRHDIADYVDNEYRNVLYERFCDDVHMIMSDDDDIDCLVGNLTWRYKGRDTYGKKSSAVFNCFSECPESCADDIINAIDWKWTNLYWLHEDTKLSEVSDFIGSTMSDYGVIERIIDNIDEDLWCDEEYLDDDDEDDEED